MTTHIDAAVDLIKTNRVGTSVVEIKRLLESRGLDTEGDIAVESGDCPNLIVWAGMSKDFADVLKALLRDDRVTVNSTSVLVYLCDGDMLTFPVAKRAPKNGYRKPHWAPICFASKPASRNAA